MTRPLLSILSGFTYTDKLESACECDFPRRQAMSTALGTLFDLCWPALSQAMPTHSSAVRLLQGPVSQRNWMQSSQFWRLKCLLAQVCLTLFQLPSLASRNRMFDLPEQIMPMCSTQLSHMLLYSLSQPKEPGCDFGMAWESFKGSWFHSSVGWKNKSLSERTAINTPSRGGERRFLSFWTVVAGTSNNIPWRVCWRILTTSFIWTLYASGVSFTTEVKILTTATVLRTAFFFFFKTKKQGEKNRFDCKASVSRVPVNQIHKNSTVLSFL